MSNRKGSGSRVHADRPSAVGNRAYHLHTRPGDIAPLCLLVGAPERAEMIAKEFLKHAKLVGDHRGLKSYSGMFKDFSVSVVTTGMGAPSTGIVLPEAYASGARIFIRVGSCSTLLPEPKPGDAIIVTAAVRLEGASRNWAPIEYPAVAHHRVVNALADAAELLAKGHHFIGVEATTDCFNEGQARPNLDDDTPEAMQAQHRALIRLGVACYSMEAAALFIWCATHAKRLGGLPAGAINAVYGNRITNEFATVGDRPAIEIALHACSALVSDPTMAKYLNDRGDK